MSSGKKLWIPGEAHSLDGNNIQRYSRQLLVPSFGVQGQTNLLKSSIVVIGAGGLGSPAALYLAAAGVGTLGIVDQDLVELNNLHRQVIHTEARIGANKARSAADSCRALNSSINVVAHEGALTAANALGIIGQYDVVVDATDNVPTRYLINDACVVAGKALVSGAALGLEGQMTVYNHSDGPCYRCLFPKPPPIAACGRCADAGVLGVVPGIIGSMQALEAIKIASGRGDPLSRRMLIFDALSGSINIVKLRGKVSGCIVCGENPEITAENLHAYRYAEFTEMQPTDKVPTRKQMLPLDQCVSWPEFLVKQSEPHVLLDVRAKHQYAIAALPSSINIPYATLESRVDEVRSAMAKATEKAKLKPSRLSRRQSSNIEKELDSTANISRDGEIRESCGSCSTLADESRDKPNWDRGVGVAVGDGEGDVLSVPVYVMCRRGNDSQRAVKLLREIGVGTAIDLTGGLEAWAKDVDPSFPVY